MDESKVINDKIENLERRVQEQASELGKTNQTLQNEIIKHKDTEEELKESERRFRKVARHVDDIIFQLSPSGFIQYVSPTVKRYGYRPQELIGRHLRKTTPIKDIPKALRMLKAVIKGRAVDKYLINQRTKNGEIICMEVEASPIRKEGKVIGFLGIMKDVTEHKKGEMRIKQERKKSEELITRLNTAYRELKETQDELVRRERMATAGTFAAGIAHEVRNPLVNLSMSAEQLKKIIKPDKPKFKHIEIIKKNTDRINFLITELLNCARPPRLNLRAYDIRKLLKAVIDSNINKIRLQKIKIIKDFASKANIVKLDKEFMERVFLNLVGNAIEAMPKGGKLTIATELNQDFLVAKVQDTGKGIPEDEVMKIFDPFFSTKQEGVGLGLTICYGIIVSHGGTIEVESKPKKGSTFTISLPIGQKMRERERERERKKELPYQT